jgi:hypothetical protein
MNKREKMLAIGVAALVALFALYYVFDTVAGQFSDRNRQLDDLNRFGHPRTEKNRRLESSLAAKRRQAGAFALSRLAVAIGRRSQTGNRDCPAAICYRPYQHV